MLQIDYVKNLTDWTADDVAIYEAQFSGRGWRELNNSQKSASSTGLLFKIAIISGCQLPSQDIMFKSMEDELIKGIDSDKKYSSLTVEEIITAFRMNSAGKLMRKVIHYNNLFNMDYFYDVINQYLELRADVRIKADQQRTKLLPPVTKDENISWEEICENCYQEYLSGVYNFLTWPVNIYDVCVTAEYFEENFYNDFKDEARIYLTHPKHIGMIQEPNMNKVFLTMISELRKEENLDVINVAKKMALRYMFKKAKEVSYEHLFIKY
jgi:hypothetical protein